MPTRQTLCLPATADGLRQASEAISTRIRSQGLSSEVGTRALTTLDEVLSNVIRHSLSGRPGVIQLTIESGEGVLVVEVADSADAFNPLLQPGPATDEPIDERQPGGLGIALVRALADEVRYERRDDQNRLRLRFEPRRAMPAGPR